MVALFLGQLKGCKYIYEQRDLAVSSSLDFLDESSAFCLCSGQFASVYLYLCAKFVKVTVWVGRISKAYQENGC